VLLVMIVWLLIQRKTLGMEYPSNWKWGVSFFSGILATAFAIYAIMYLPPLDFRPYKIGSNIAKNMENSAELKYGKEIYTYTNLKSGKDEQYEKWEKKLSDTLAYKFKSFEKPLLNPEALPKIKDYRVTTASGEDITKQTFTGKKLLIIVSDLRRSNHKVWKEINALALESEKKKIEPIILTGDNEATFEVYRHEFQIKIPYYFADKTVLKTMIRSNPGLMYWHEGTVKNMWHYNSMPTVKDFE
jgi:hypothetical protein